MNGLTEEINVSEQVPVRLTQLSHGGGCGCKIAPAVLQQIQRRTARANPYLPVWLVAPRAWARPPVSTPRYDGSGRVLLQELRKGR